MHSINLCIKEIWGITVKECGKFRMKNEEALKIGYVNRRVESVFGVDLAEMLGYIGCLNY